LETMRDLLTALIGLAIASLALYLIVRVKKITRARIWVIVIISIAAIPTSILSIYTICLLCCKGPIPDLYILVTGLVVGISIVILFLKDGILRYIATLTFSVLASINVAVWLHPSFTFLLLALFPLVDLILVYYGPLRRLVHLAKDEVPETVLSSKQIPAYNPLLDLTVKIDGVLIGLGDFLLYSIAATWSLMVLSSKFGPYALILTLTLTIPSIAIGFYLNIRACLKKGYGPATVGPLTAVLIVTLILFTLL